MVHDGEASLRYADVISRAEALAAWMLSEGVEAGDRVVVQLRKGINEILLMYAAARINAVFVNVHPLYSSSQLLDVIERSSPRLVVVEEAKSQSVPAQGGYRVAVGSDDTAHPEGLWRLAALCASPVSLPAPAGAAALATIIYTSGSTGHPKGVMHSHQNLIDFGACVAEYLGNRASDRILALLPLSFGYGLSQILSVAHAGASLYLQKTPLPAEILDALDRFEITGLGAVPSVWRQLVTLQESMQRPLPHLRYITNAGDDPGDVLVDALMRTFSSADLVLMYGTSETLRSSYLPPAWLAAKKGAIGRAVPGVELWVLTDDGRVGQAGDSGTLMHGGKHLMMGYWRDPEATADKLRTYPDLRGHERPYYFTEDRVRLDEDGCLWFVGRASWMVKKNGFKVSLREVEQIVTKLQIFAQCVAIVCEPTPAVPDIHLVVIPSEADGRDSQTMLKIMRKYLPAYMLPAVLSYWPEKTFPYTANGKIDKSKIAQHFSR